MQNIRDALRRMPPFFRSNAPRRIARSGRGAQQDAARRQENENSKFVLEWFGHDFRRNVITPVRAIR